MNGLTWWEEVLLLGGIIWFGSLLIVAVKRLILSFSSKVIDDVNDTPTKKEDN